MISQAVRTTDLEHRLHVLYAWKEWKDVSTSDLRLGASYRAVLDGCGITIRTLCYVMGIGANFRDFDDARYPDSNPARTAALFKCLKTGQNLIRNLDNEEQRCLLEVIFFGNRAIAHPNDGPIPDHKVGPKEMTVARLAVLKLLQESSNHKDALRTVNPEFLKP